MYKQQIATICLSGSGRLVGGVDHCVAIAVRFWLVIVFGCPGWIQFQSRVENIRNQPRDTSLTLIIL